ncbi:hypothetical protein ACS0TY_012508 [Phlomoides rotata]
MQMNGETCRTKMKSQMVEEGTLYKTKRFFLKTFRNVRFFLFRGGYRKLPRNPFAFPIFSSSRRIGPKLQEMDDEAVKKEQRKGDDQCSRVSDQSGVGDLREEKKTRRYSGRKEEEPSFLATENFAQKVEELEMMDVNNGDHVMDIDEVIHQYSLLTSPVYLDIVDKFFTDVYVELYVPQPSKSLSSSKRKQSSMRKLDSGSVHGSMRKLDSASVHGSMKKVGSASVHGSMRKVGSASVHGSMRKVGSASVHGSMRKVGSASVHGSMRKSDSTSVHCAMMKLGPDSSVHSSTRNLAPLKL